MLSSCEEPRIVKAVSEAMAGCSHFAAATSAEVEAANAFAGQRGRTPDSDGAATCARKQQRFRRIAWIVSPSDFWQTSNSSEWMPPAECALHRVSSPKLVYGSDWQSDRNQRQRSPRWLLQRIRDLWRMCCAIVFCKCFRDYFRSAVLTRLFDDADYVLFAHPHGAVRIVFYAISV